MSQTRSSNMSNSSKIIGIQFSILSPEEIRVTEEDTYIGITSVLHLEDGPASITKIGVPTEQATFNMN